MSGVMKVHGEEVKAGGQRERELQTKSSINTGTITPGIIFNYNWYKYSIIPFSGLFPLFKTTVLKTK